MMSANDAQNSSLSPGDDPTQRVEVPGDEIGPDTVHRAQVLPQGSFAPLIQPRSATPSERLPAAARQRQTERARPSDSARRGITPPSESRPLPGAPIAPVSRSARRQSPPPSANGLYFPWWSLVLLVGLVGLITLGVVLAVGRLTEPNVPGNQPAQVQIVTALPTLSQDFTSAESSNPQPQQTLWPTAIPVMQPSPTGLLPTPVPSPSLPPGEIMIGVRVSVVGVDTSGLNIRSAPGYTGSPRFLATEGDEFVVVDGPQVIDEIEWWRVEDPDDSNRYGWAARNYLAVVSQ